MVRCMSQEGITEPKRMDGNYWILKLGKEKDRGCSQVQEIKLLVDVDEWNPEELFNSIHKLMLEKEKSKA